ncbi:Os08g0530033 [Oryza sativa Japonica Group]|uniref:Os08g0530033 protein n=1 Tax=Oryza sativa subsp. japonica TaxID=39947 RepID=A0A0P0XJ31_ORYSJ|nr:hypothetical protein EE612_045528 [Oryza sativa]BAT06384.1 Os08g0530033 [Oryza sativa Japonica Group]
MATWLSPPRGMITSAYFLEGRTKSSNAGFTNLPYYNSISTEMTSLPLSTVSRLIRRARATNLCQQKFSYPSNHEPFDHEKLKCPPK